MEKLILRHRNLIYLVFLFLIISCKNDKRTTQRKQDLVYEMKLKEVLLILNNANSIDGAAVGIAGIRTPVYDSYEWLQNNAPDSVLIGLTGHRNPYKKTYAFMALCKRKSQSVRLLFYSNIHDTSNLNMIDGCLASNCQLNFLWLGTMQSLIDSSEYVSISKKINKNFPIVSACFFPN